MRSHDARTLGQAIRTRRKEPGYTQAFVAEVTGFSVTFISDLENGKATAEIAQTILYKGGKPDIDGMSVVSSY